MSRFPQVWAQWQPAVGAASLACFLAPVVEYWGVKHKEDFVSPITPSRWDKFLRASPSTYSQKPKCLRQVALTPWK